MLHFSWCNEVEIVASHGQENEVVLNFFDYFACKCNVVLKREKETCCHCKCFIEHLKKLKAVKSLYWVLYPLPEVLRKRLFCIKETTFDVLLKMMQYYWYQTHILMLFFYFLQCLHQSGNLSNCCTNRHSRKQTHKSKSITRLECFIKPQNAIFYLCEKHFAQRNANENLSREIMKKYYSLLLYVT